MEPMGSLLAWLAASAVATVIWGVRLEGRVNTQEQLTDQRFDGIKELLEAEFKSISQRLDRIERSMNGRLHRE